MTTTDSRPAKHTPMSNRAAPDASSSRPTTGTPLPIGLASGGSASPAAIEAAPPRSASPQGTQSTGRHVPIEAQHTDAAGSTSLGAEFLAVPKVAAPRGSKTAGRQMVYDAHGELAVGSNVPDPAAATTTTPEAPSLLDPALCLAADVLDDIERVRIANENRLRQLTRSEKDSDGERRGFGFDPDHPDVMRLGIMIETLKKVEHEATLELQRKMRKHPLGDWVKAQRGVGLKQGARLLAAIGDPYWNAAKDAPRTGPAQLWAYCGLHVLPGGHGTGDTQQAPAAGDQHRDADPEGDDNQCGSVGVAAKRRRGERANWSTKAKTRAHLIAESCIKQLSPDCRGGHSVRATQATSAAPACACSPYRVVYDERRAHTAVTRPEWTDGHSHNDALRVASKEILKDLWRAARDWHHGGPR